MTRLRPVLIPACAVVTALLLAACGSDKAKTTTIVGAQSVAPTASASASASPGALPDGVLPDGYTIEVDTPNTGDPAKDAVLAANLSFYRAEYQAIGKQDANDPLWQKWAGIYNLEFNAKASTRTYIQGYIDKKHSVIGTLRVYDEVVTGITASQASLQWCEDETRAYAKDLVTGKTLYTTPSRGDFFFYSSILQKNPQGRWITTAIMSKEGDNRCS